MATGPVPEALRHMNLVSPGGFEHFFAEADRWVDAGSQLDPATVGDQAARYGVTVLRPPRRGDVRDEPTPACPRPADGATG